MVQDPASQAAVLAPLLLARGQSLVTAESCTGGWVAKICTDLTGSSAWFERGFVTYSNESKQELLDAQIDLVLAHFDHDRPATASVVAEIPG